MSRPFLITCSILSLSAATLAQTAPQPAVARSEQPKGVNRPMLAPGSQPEDPALLSQRCGGSLVRATLSSPVDPQAAVLKDVSYFSVPEPEPRTIKKHDLVTIIVNEESEFSSKGTTDLKKSADFDAKIDAFVRFSLAKMIKTEGSRDFKGDASVDRSDTFTARITAEVLDVKPNNTLVLQARQHIKTDDEEQTMILSGVCRVDDVTPDNTVLSTQIFDKDLTKTHKGAVYDTQKRGWVPKLLDVVNPF
jgi:flagellar L-ring protein precursor FlgH